MSRTTPETMMQYRSSLQQLAICSLFVLAAACSNWAPAECDGLVCPPEHICSADNKTCISKKNPCGNAVVDEGEICDDGNVISEGTCSWNCRATIDCGNGVKDEGEACDPLTNPSCWPDCSNSDSCGNGKLDPDEECEDSPGIMDNRCVNCQLLWCGNGKLEPELGEVCDKNALDEMGNNIKCSDDCMSDLTCGNGIKDPGEACDDKNDPRGGCSDNCQKAAECGDGHHDEETEECDCGSPGMISDDPECKGNPNSSSSGFCSLDCTEHCNDGELNQEERDQTCDGQLVFCADRGSHLGSRDCDGSCELVGDACRDISWREVIQVSFAGVWGMDQGSIVSFARDGKIYERSTEATWVSIGPDVASEVKPLNDIWRDEKNIFAVGDEGRITRRRRVDPKDPSEAPSFEWHYYVFPEEEEEEGRKNLHGVWGASKSVFSVGKQGEILVLNGEGEQPQPPQWERMTYPSDLPLHDLHDVWGTDIANVFAVGESGTILHYDGNRGNRWEKMHPVANYTLLAIWGADEENIVAVGKSGFILHYDGQRWRRKESPTDSALTAVWGSAADEIYAAGRDGTLLYYDGMNWSPIRTGLSNQESKNVDFTDLWAVSEEISVVGDNGTLYQFSPVLRSESNEPFTEMSYGTYETH